MFRSWSLKRLSMRARAEESPREEIGHGGAQEREAVYATRVQDEQTAQETSSLLPRAATVPTAQPLPAAHAVSSAVVVGVPVVRPLDKGSDPEGLEYTPNLHVGEMTRPGFSLGVDGDLEGARIAARISARQDNHNLDRSGWEALARQRVEQEERELQIARINARRREMEGLDMAPHPGNCVDSNPEKRGLRNEKAFAYGATTMGEGKGYCEEKVGGQESQSGSSQKESEEDSYTAGGYQTSDYEPAEYQVSEYKSVYDS